MTHLCSHLINKCLLPMIQTLFLNTGVYKRVSKTRSFYLKSLESSQMGYLINNARNIKPIPLEKQII